MVPFRIGKQIADWLVKEIPSLVRTMQQKDMVMRWTGEYDYGKKYNRSDVCRKGTMFWIAVKANTNDAPATNSQSWEKLF